MVSRMALLLVGVVFTLSLTIVAAGPPLNCAIVSRMGYVYDMSNVDLTSGSYYGRDGDDTYAGNWCGTHTVAPCADEDGNICVFNQTTGAYKNAVARNWPPPITWSPLNDLLPNAGLKLETDNGFYGSRQVISRMDFICKSDSTSRELHVFPDKVKFLFRFELETPYSCPVDKAVVRPAAFALPLDKSWVQIPVVLSSAPPNNLSIQLESFPPYLIESESVLVRGPPSVKKFNYTVFINIRLSARATATQGPFKASVVISGFDAEIYQKFPAGDVTVSTYAVAGPSSSGISGGSVFLILFFVFGFLYIAGGCLWNHSKHGTNGMASCPHLEFWRSVYDHAVAGCKYFMKIICCGRVGPLQYKEINDTNRGHEEAH